MRLLTALNLILATAGYNQVNSILDPHPFIPACLAQLEVISTNEQQRGWWFNREKLTLLPSSIDNAVYLPGDFINVWVNTCNRKWMGMRLVERGDRLYNTNGGTYSIGVPVDVVIVRQVPFEELPEVAAQHIAAVARLWAQTTYDGDGAKANAIAASMVFGVQGTLSRLNAEEVRNTPLNIFDITRGTLGAAHIANTLPTGGGQFYQ
jgi:hypothetical protein